MYVYARTLDLKMKYPTQFNAIHYFESFHYTTTYTLGIQSDDGNLIQNFRMQNFNLFIRNFEHFVSGRNIFILSGYKKIC